MSDEIYYNTDVLFIEIYDILIDPFFQMLRVNIDNKSIHGVDYSEIRNLSSDGLREWYVNRKHVNPFEDLVKGETAADIKNICYTMMDMDERFIGYSNHLSFYNVAKNILGPSSDLVKEVIFYTNEYSKNAEKFTENFGTKKKALYRYGDLESALPKMGVSATYVFSDITKVNVLEESGKLYLSSIMIPAEYRYNKKNFYDYKVDFDKMRENTVFKYNFFSALK